MGTQWKWCKISDVGYDSAFSRYIVQLENGSRAELANHEGLVLVDFSENAILFECPERKKFYVYMADSYGGVQKVDEENFQPPKAWKTKAEVRFFKSNRWKKILDDGGVPDEDEYNTDLNHDSANQLGVMLNLLQQLGGRGLTGVILGTVTMLLWAAVVLSFGRSSPYLGIVVGTILTVFICAVGRRLKALFKLALSAIIMGVIFVMCSGDTANNDQISENAKIELEGHSMQIFVAFDV